MAQAENSNFDKTNILGVLAVIAESWWLLLGAPLVFAAVAFGFVYLSPVTHQAKAEVTLANNDPALTCIADRLRSGSGKYAACTTAFGVLISLEGVDLRDTSPVVSAEAKDLGPLLTVSVASPDANKARGVALEVVRVLRSFEPAVRTLYERWAVQRQAEADRLQNAIDVLQQSATTMPRGSSDNDLQVDSAAYALVTMSDALTAKQTGVMDAQRQAAQTEMLMAVSPTVTITEIPRDHRPIVAAFLVGAVLAVVLIYLRYALSLVRQVPDYAEKRERILRALPFQRRRTGATDGH